MTEKNWLDKYHCQWPAFTQRSKCLFGPACPYTTYSSHKAKGKINYYYGTNTCHDTLQLTLPSILTAPPTPLQQALLQLETAAQEVCTWAGSTGTSSLVFPTPWRRNAQMLQIFFWPTRESTSFTPWRAGIFKKRGNINYTNVSLDRHEWEQVSQKKCRWALVGVGLCLITLSHPLQFHTALSQLYVGCSHTLGLCCVLGHWLYSSAESLTQFHLCMT